MSAYCLVQWIRLRVAKAGGGECARDTRCAATASNLDDRGHRTTHAERAAVRKAARTSAAHCFASSRNQCAASAAETPESQKTLLVERSSGGRAHAQGTFGGICVRQRHRQPPGRMHACSRVRAASPGQGAHNGGVDRLLGTMPDHARWKARARRA